MASTGRDGILILLSAQLSGFVHRPGVDQFRGCFVSRRRGGLISMVCKIQLSILNIFFFSKTIIKNMKNPFPRLVNPFPIPFPLGWHIGTTTTPSNPLAACIILSAPRKNHRGLPHLRPRE